MERIDVETDFGQIKTVSKEGLIKMKTLSGREQDMLDIKNLENNNE